MFGCGIDVVREIVPNRRATRLPGAPASVQGLINLRGTLVTVVNLAVWLGDERPATAEGSIVLVEHGGKVAGIAVDDVLDVQHVVVDPAAGAAGDRDGAIRGMGRLGDTVVILLDIARLVEQILA